MEPENKFPVLARLPSTISSHCTNRRFFFVLFFFLFFSKFRRDENLFANFFMLERGTRDYSSALRGVALIFAAASQPPVPYNH